MAVKIRLARRGRKSMAIYDVVVADARAPRDGRYIERIGRYDPNTDPALIELDDAKAFEWVMKGAQPTDTVRAMLSYKGIMLKKHLQVGVNKGAITQEDADKKFEAWLADKEGKIQSKREKLATDAASSAKSRKDAEAKIKEARAESLKQRAAEAEAAAAPAPEEGAEEEVVAETAEAPAVEEKATEEAPVEEVKAEVPAEEAPATEEAPVAEAKEEKAVEEAPKAEASEEPAAEEVKEETPKAEAKEEKTTEEAPKEESSEEEEKKDA